MKILNLLTRKKTFTLVEIIIVVTIIAILAAFALPGYYNARSRALDGEANSQLQLIQAAEEKTYLETGVYELCANNADCNTELKIDLLPSRANGGNWTYDVFMVNMGATPPIFTARAIGAGGSTWYIDQDDIGARR